jgi:uncharacterized protein (DUF58 family)
MSGDRTASTSSRVQHRANQLLSIGLHTFGVFGLPIATAAGLVVAFHAREVAETASRAVVVVAALVVPLVALQAAGIVVRAMRLWRQQHAHAPRGFFAVVDVLATATAVVTRRGGWAIASGLVGLALAIVAGQAEFVVFAVVVLAAAIVVVAVANAVATFGVRIAGDRCALRVVEPAVIGVGEPVRDTFVVDAVVPRGFGLRIAAPLPVRLGDETRVFVDGDPRRRSTRASVPLSRTPRGVHVLPAATVVVEDLLGLTAVVVGASTAARCKVLPRLRPVAGASTLLSPSPRADDVVVPQPRAREDLYDLRPFVRGDDPRRIHWRQTMRAGEWIVRTPECRPTQSRRIDVVLDTFVAADLCVTDDDHAAVAAVFDVLVDAWLGIADQLRRDGHDVVLVAAVPRDDGAVTVEALSCRATRDSAWRDLGARAVAQAQVPLDDVVADRSHAIVVSCGLGALAAAASTAVTRVVVDALALVPATLADVPRWSWRSLLLLPHAAGSDDNLPGAAAERRRRDKARLAARTALRTRLQERRTPPRDTDVAVVLQRGSPTLAPLLRSSTMTNTTTKKKTTTTSRRVA